MIDSPSPRTVTVDLLAAPESSVAVLYSLYEVFDHVGAVWPTLTGQTDCGVRFAPRVIAAGGDPLVGANGLPIAVSAGLDDPPSADIALVTDLTIGPGDDPRGRWAEATAWLARRHAAGAIVGSVCTGSLVLAEAGLLDGLEATTHWAARDAFARYYPAVDLRADRVLVPAGPGHRIVTAGGAASWSELALYLIARFAGREEATRIAKLFLLGDRSDGQLPFAAMTRPRDHGDAAIAACQEWIAAHYATANPVARLIERSGLAPRTFKRRFRAATGLTPIDYVQHVRVEEAKQMLEMSDDPVDVVAEQAGYQDPTSFRRVFKRLAGETPARYRQRYRISPAARAVSMLPE